MFHHWEYVGDDFDADMASLDNDDIIKFWWTYCEPCQDPLTWEGPPPSQGGTGGPGGAWWAPLKCLNHCGGWPVAWAQSWPGTRDGTRTLIFCSLEDHAEVWRAVPCMQ